MKNLWATLAVLLAGAAFSGATASAAASRPPAGANGHWSFLAPVLPPVPAVKRQRWPRNPIDAFVLARLEREHLAPSLEADRPILLRRLSLDLIGLPPSPEQLEAFLSDRRPDAYEQLVDSLLASPHFGERWARHWLDLARYADSEGYQIDRPRPGAYVYRNWVIDAINQDLPFDQFTIEQLAGDLLPDATLAQKIATGFHRNTLMNWEDGVDREEFRCKAKVDRVSTTGTVWLGLTVGCAECHSHKYDPISQREFYQLYALFNRAAEVDVPAPQPGDQRARGQAFQELSNAPVTHVHIRGDFLRPGDEVPAGVLSALHPFEPRAPEADRLDLARWLVAPANPLTSRVAVNHVWQHLFGRGLVGTPDDFGARGERPSHPELLDWLAVTFASRPSSSLVADPPPPALHWSRKQLIRLIVTSATYRQSSRVRPKLLDRDPLNILLARQSRFRLESEIIRDSFLAASGLLNTTVGGPSFRPQTPPDFKKLGAAGAFKWEDSTGPEQYRRGLYIFAQRTVPYQTAMTFDQANPCESCPRREQSNTPLQALTLLNHGLFIECARGLARRLTEDATTTGPDREIARGFALCLGRKPTRNETARLQKLFHDARRLAQDNPQSVAPLLHDATLEQAGVPEAAARIILAQVMLNLEEFITRE